MTLKQERDFSEAVVPQNFLMDAIDWIKDNMEVYDVFHEKQIIEYASGLKPDKVFTQSELEAWAELNGFIKE